MNNEIIKNEFTINLEREGFSIHVKEVDRSAKQEEAMTEVNSVINPFFKDLMMLGKTVEQIVCTRSDKVEVSIIRVEGLPWSWEIAVFDDVKGKVKAALKNNPLPGMEACNTKDEALERAVELLLVV
jgi:hypothetical protein